MGVFLRWVFAFVLLAVTYNPTDWNYVRWTLANYENHLSLAVLLGLILLIGYIVYARATIRSIGGFGMLLVVAVVGALLWVLYDFGLLSLENDYDNIVLRLRCKCCELVRYSCSCTFIVTLLLRCNCLTNLSSSLSPTSVIIIIY